MSIPPRLPPGWAQPATPATAAATGLATSACPSPTPPPGAPGAGPVMLSEAVRAVLRRMHYSPRTEEAYLHWVREFVRFHGRRHPRDLAGPEITAYLNHLAVEREVAASTQNQALCALIYLYKHVLRIELPALAGLERAKRPIHLPTVITKPEALRLIDCLNDPSKLIAQLLYGSGLRLMECLALRIKDVDLERRQLTVRRGKGGKDRPAILPRVLWSDLRHQMALVEARHKVAVRAGQGEVDLPYALHRKLPGAATSLEWQYLFPAARPCLDERSGRRVLHHLHESVVQRAITAASALAHLGKRVTAHTLRHSFATELLQANVDIRTIQTLLGHEDVSTTMIYTHLVDQGPLGVRSPLDR